jgi:8-oxo-dGTP diphosphatase
MIDSNFDIDDKIFGEKLENIEYIDRRAVYGIVINDEGEIAVIKTPTGYFLPGGGIENSETYVECLQREFVEETGYEAEVEKFIGRASLYHTSKTNQYLRGIGYFYTASLKFETSYKVEMDHELLWVEPDQCIKCLFLEHQAWAVSKALGLA